MRLQEARTLLEAGHYAGVGPVAAFWFVDQGIESWRLALVYPEHDEVGSRPVYERILPAIKPDSRLSLYDFTVIGLRSDLVKEVRATFGKRNVTPDRPRHSYVRGGEVVVYRA